MCGRTACTLIPEDICRACSYKKKRRGSKWTIPEWTECPSGRTYHPSPNVAPTSHTPVLVAKRKSDVDEDVGRSTALERVVQPMYWSLVPSWHKGQLKELGLSTNNARYEGITEKTLFNVPLKKGRRCVVLSDGYYEWKEEGKAKKAVSKKQPYLIYFPQPDGIIPGDPSWKETLGECAWSSKGGWKGPRLLTMAGVYDVWKDPNDDTLLYSYAIVTMDSSKTVAFIHERMPAILDGEDAVRDWLDHENVPLEAALKLIVPVEKLVCHPVSKAVGNSRNKWPSCVAEIDPESETKAESKSRALMEKWLKTPSSSSGGGAKSSSPRQKQKSSLKRKLNEPPECE